MRITSRLAASREPQSRRCEALARADDARRARLRVFFVEGLGHAFLMRNYRAGLAKWQTADPMGYPDGWNQLTYCGNGVVDGIDLFGALYTEIIDGNSNKPNKRVSFASLLTVGTNSSQGSFRYDISFSLNAVTRDISATITVALDVNPNLPRSSSVMKGSIATYTEHVSAPDDATLSGIYEPVYEHELGHAHYFIDTLYSKLFNSLYGLELQWKSYGGTVQAVQSQADAIWATVINTYMEPFVKAANQPTISWFDNSPDWTFVSHNNIVWKWVKE